MFELVFDTTRALTGKPIPWSPHWHEYKDVHSSSLRFPTDTAFSGFYERIMLFSRDEYATPSTLKGPTITGKFVS